MSCACRIDGLLVMLVMDGLVGTAAVGQMEVQLDPRALDRLWTRGLWLEI